MDANIYSTGEAIYGKGAQVRIAIIAAGAATTRPLAAAFTVLHGVTTSEIKGGQETKDTPVDYDSAATQDWANGSPGTRNWSFSMSANQKADTAQATQLKNLWNAWAAGQFVYVERLNANSTEWVGGLAFITDPSEPVPADGIVTFSCGFTGKGAITRTADA